MFDSEHKLFPQSRSQGEGVDQERLLARAHVLLRGLIPEIYAHRLGEYFKPLRRLLLEGGGRLEALPAPPEQGELALILSALRRLGYRLSLAGFNRQAQGQGWPGVRAGILRRIDY